MLKFLQVFFSKREDKIAKLNNTSRQINFLLKELEQELLENTLTNRELQIRLMEVINLQEESMKLIAELNKSRIYSYWLEKTSKRINHLRKQLNQTK